MSIFQKYSLSVCLFVALIASFFAPPVLANPRERTATYSLNSGRTGVLIDTAIFYGQSQASAEPSAGNEWNNVTSIYDLKAGYIFPSQFYVGGGYSMRSDSSQTSTTSGGAGLVGIGYFWSSGFNVRAFYRLNDAWGSYSDGTGYQADLGYMMNLSSNFYLGLLLSNRQVTFSKNSTIVNFQSFTKKDTQPMLTFGFLFN